MSKIYNFELLVIDPNGKSEILSPKSLVYGLLSTEKLWDNAKEKEDSGKYSIEDGSLSIKIKPLDTASTLYDLIEAGFVIKVTCKDFDKIEKFRYPFLICLRNRLSFSHLRILTDDVSTEISNKAYPLINELEHLLRRYISKFFTQKIGLEWWTKAVPDGVIGKTKLRSENETIFSQLVQTDLTLIDFDDLGEIIYKHKLGFNRPENLIESLLKTNTIEELDKLKTDLDSNYNRFFKQNFKDLDFDKKWKQLFKIRNKVAHNNLFVIDDLTLTNDLYKDLKNLISKAEEKIDDFKFSLEEQVAIRETITENKRDYSEKIEGLKVIGKIELPKHTREEYEPTFDTISEDEFFKELDNAERTLRFNNLTYVGLKAFITKILGQKGYQFGTSYALANILKEQGLIEIYDVDDEASYWPVKAIRKKK